jgi:hypothetical protein
MIADQRIIYARYLLPIVPMLCVFAAAAVISGVSLLRRYQFPRGVRTALIAGLALALLAPPAVTAVAFNRTIARESTVDQAYSWIVANVPPGASMALEGGHLVLAGYRTERMPQLRLKTYDDFVSDGTEYLVASSQCYGPYLQSPRDFRAQYTDYMTLFARTDEVARFTPADGQPGPELRILKVRR